MPKPVPQQPRFFGDAKVWEDLRKRALENLQKKGDPDFNAAQRLFGKDVIERRKEAKGKQDPLAKDQGKPNPP